MREGLHPQIDAGGMQMGTELELDATFRGFGHPRTVPDQPRTSPTGQWSEPVTFGRMKASRIRGAKAWEAPK